MIIADLDLLTETEIEKNRMQFGELQRREVWFFSAPDAAIV
jgi:hypothetical protein